MITVKIAKHQKSNFIKELTNYLGGTFIVGLQVLIATIYTQKWNQKS